MSFSSIPKQPLWLGGAWLTAVVGCALVANLAASDAKGGTLPEVGHLEPVEMNLTVEAKSLPESIL